MASVPIEVLLQQRRAELELAKVDTQLVEERAKQSELDERHRSHSLLKRGRAAALAIGMFLSLVGVSDAVLPDDPNVLGQFSPLVTILTNHEGDPLQTTLAGAGLMVPSLIGRRRPKRKSADRTAADA